VTGREPVPLDSDPPRRADPRPIRMTLGHLMIGIALLAVVLAVAIQSVVIQHRAAELERWGRSLRERERYLRQMGAASRQAAQGPGDHPRDDEMARGGTARDDAWEREGLPPRATLP
jgi:hypothetical protein